tara:strand:- start:515 stop:1462 length:948 start_codon:yes stop_codon:yes gene_type:complete
MLMGEVWFPNRVIFQTQKMISGKTSLLAVIGDPVSHSLSPIMQNAALKALDLDWCYLAIKCEKRYLKEIINALHIMSFKGINVTIPHKQEVIKFCNNLTETATRLGSVNTLIPDESNGWIGHNTDLEGFKSPLIKNNWENKTAIILGSGGSARAVLEGLIDLSFKKIVIVARNKLSSKHLIDNHINLGIKDDGLVIDHYFPDDKNLQEIIPNTHLIVNTTPVGMKSLNKSHLLPTAIPFGTNTWQNINTNTLMYDLIYNPNPTAFMQLMTDKGCKTINGMDMLVSQGAASLRKWTNLNEIPLNIMKEALEKFNIK